MVKQPEESYISKEVKEVVMEMDAQISIAREIYVQNLDYTREGAMKAFDAAMVFMEAAAILYEGKMRNFNESLKEENNEEVN